MDAMDSISNGDLKIRQIEPTDLSPGEFASQVVDAVEKDGVTLVVIDSINGYLQSMPEERLLPIQIHELLSFLSNNGVTCIMTLVQHGIFGSPVDEAADVSYLADTVILMRYFEVNGSVRQSISVVKKRSGDHERTHSRMPRARGRSAGGRAAARLPGCSHRRAALYRWAEAADERSHCPGCPERRQSAMTTEATADAVCVALLTPTGRDASVASRILKDAAIPVAPPEGLDELCELIESGEAGVLLIAEEALGGRNSECLLNALEKQPSWSDVPIVILTGQDELSGTLSSGLRAIAMRGNVTLLERPVRVATLDYSTSFSCQSSATAIRRPRSCHQ